MTTLIAILSITLVVIFLRELWVKRSRKVEPFYHGDDENDPCPEDHPHV